MGKKFMLACAALALAGGSVALAAVPRQIEDCVSAGDFSAAEGLIAGGGTGLTAFEADSLLAIMTRIRGDFSVAYEEGVRLIQERYANATVENIKDWEARNYIEVKTIDGEKRMFRKSLTNLDRLVPELSSRKRALGNKNAAVYASYAEEAIGAAGADGLDGGHRVTARFTIDVDADAVPAGEKIRVWMPFPIVSERQKDVELISSSDDVTYSASPTHNTIYMERVAEKGVPTHFEAVFAYTVYSKYVSRDSLVKLAIDYDKSSELYAKYTAQESPQIMLTDKMRALALKIVGNETNPVMQAGLIYDWIHAYFPWAGAREYSTIPNLAEYVLERGYGDCGQVTLLYITLLRSIGIPARWESGWQLEPGSEGLHDWGEAYFEGVGWVPVDMSYGLLECTDDDAVRNFYKSGIDFYRFAANRGVCGKFSPEKEYVRSETVDSQLGEVEWRGGNLFYYNGWRPRLEVISFEALR